MNIGYRDLREGSVESALLNLLNVLMTEKTPQVVYSYFISTVCIGWVEENTNPSHGSCIM